MVVLDEAQWSYILFGHEEMADPEVAGRERLFRRGVGPQRWLRVVVEFRGGHDWVVTAFPQENDPTA